MPIGTASSLVTDLGKNAAVLHRQLWIDAGPLPTIFLICLSANWPAHLHLGGHRAKSGRT